MKFNHDIEKYKKTLLQDPNAVHIHFPESFKKLTQPLVDRFKKHRMNNIVEEISSSLGPIKEVFEKYPGCFTINTVDGKPLLNIDLDQLDKFIKK